MPLNELLSDAFIGMLMASDRVDVHELRETAREILSKVLAYGEGRRDQRHSSLSCLAPIRIAG